MVVSVLCIGLRRRACFGRKLQDNRHWTILIVHWGLGTLYSADLHFEAETFALGRKTNCVKTLPTPIQHVLERDVFG